VIHPLLIFSRIKHLGLFCFWRALSIVNALVPKNNKSVVFISFPDMSDNASAFYNYLIDNHPGRYEITWLVSSNISAVPNQQSRILKKNSVRGLFGFFRAKFVFFTHGHFGSLQGSKDQVLVNLWHGMPLKKIGHYLDDVIVPHANYCICTSRDYQKIMSIAFGLPLTNVLMVGLPRNDLFLKNRIGRCGEPDVNDETVVRKLVWLPTFRRANSVGPGRNGAGEPAQLPLFSMTDLDRLDSSLSSIPVHVYIKLHPMDVLSKNCFGSYMNISILSAEDFEEPESHLYDFLANADALITDFSSVYIDFMLTRKPIAFIAPDTLHYSESRGFIFDNLKVNDILPGEHISDVPSFLNFAQRIVSDEIEPGYLSNGLLEYYHSTTSHFSEQLYSTVLGTRPKNNQV
jgi:CDP-glycerol glycerophosphotransferase